MAALPFSENLMRIHVHTPIVAMQRSNEKYEQQRGSLCGFPRACAFRVHRCKCCTYFSPAAPPGMLGATVPTMCSTKVAWFRPFCFLVVVLVLLLRVVRGGVLTAFALPAPRLVTQCSVFSSKTAVSAVSPSNPLRERTGRGSRGKGEGGEKRED